MTSPRWGVLQHGTHAPRGDFLFVNKAVLRRTDTRDQRAPARLQYAHRGDVIVFAYPKDPTLSYVKRVSARRAIFVEMKQGQVYVNGRAIEEPYVQRKDPLHDGFDPEFNWQARVFGAPHRRTAAPLSPHARHVGSAARPRRQVLRVRGQPR